MLHYFTLATKLLDVVLFHENITQLKQKNCSPWYKDTDKAIGVIKAYTEFQQYSCIIFEDISILLSVIFIFHGLFLLLVTEISEQPRYIFANISGLSEYFSKWIFALKH